MAYTDYFQRISMLKIGEVYYQAYGNIQLLDNPFKEPVIVHRADSSETRAGNRDLWLYTACNGGVLVSPFISPDEKAIRKEAEAMNGKIILLTNEAFPERYKPSAYDFAQCSLGHLLIIGPIETLPPSRATFLSLNALADRVASLRLQRRGALS